MWTRAHCDADATVEDVGWEIFRLILDVQWSKKTWADHWDCTMSLFCLIRGR